MERMKEMKVGQLEKGLFRFVVTNDMCRFAIKGKVYESDESGIIRMEDDTEFHTHGDKGSFYEQMDLFIGCNSYIEIPDEKKVDSVVKNVNSLKHGDIVKWGPEGQEKPYAFVGFCRNEAMIRHLLYEDVTYTVPLYWLTKVGSGEVDA